MLKAILQWIKVPDLFIILVTKETELKSKVMENIIGIWMKIFLYIFFSFVKV